jgi:hypothetical protein
MDYLGPSRARSRASNNPWTALTAAERKKLADGGPECKRVVGCLERVAPVLETAAHRILVDDWRSRIWRKIQLILALLLLLFLVGGYALAYRVATAGSYTKAAGDVYGTFFGQPADSGLQQPFPLIHTPAVHDPGAPSWTAIA